MKKGFKWECDNCGADVLLIPVKIANIRNGELLYKDDTHKYECSLCDNRVVYETENSIIRAKCFDAEFINEVRDNYNRISPDALELLIVLMEFTKPPVYLCELNDGTLLGIERLCKITGLDATKIDMLVSELWKERLVMQIKFNDVKRYIVNGYKIGLENDYDKFISASMFSYDFYRPVAKSKRASQKRQLRLKILPNTFTDEQKAELLRKFNGKCAFTGKDVPIQIDHVIPVASGHGGTILENMLPIWQRINSSKGDRNVFEWYEKNGERFEVVPELFKQAIGYIAELNGMTYEEYREYVYDCHNVKLTQTN